MTPLFEYNRNPHRGSGKGKRQEDLEWALELSRTFCALATKHSKDFIFNAEKASDFRNHKRKDAPKWNGHGRYSETNPNRSAGVSIQICRKKDPDDIIIARPKIIEHASNWKRFPYLYAPHGVVTKEDLYNWGVSHNFYFLGIVCQNWDPNQLAGAFFGSYKTIPLKEIYAWHKDKHGNKEGHINAIKIKETNWNKFVNYNKIDNYEELDNVIKQGW